MTWLRSVRRAVLIALTWAVAWAPLGVLLGMILDADGSMDEPWVAVGAYPGFLCGLVFFVVLWIADRGRRLDELPLSRVSAYGAMSGLLVIVLPLSGVIGTPNTDHALWRWRLVIMAAVTLLSSGSAVASVLIARMAKKREFGDDSADVA